MIARFGFGAVLVALAACSQAPDTAADEAALRAADERQRAIVEAGDFAAMSELAHANLRINAPTNTILTRERMLAMMESGEIAGENFVRTPEAVTISGDVGVVMGRERFTATPDSASGRMFGARQLNRRYTNVYVRQDGEWRFLARHANVVSAPPTPEAAAPAR